MVQTFKVPDFERQSNLKIASFLLFLWKILKPRLELSSRFISYNYYCVSFHKCNLKMDKNDTHITAGRECKEYWLY